MTTYAAAIAARLQGREDGDMGKDIWDASRVTPAEVRAFADAVAIRLAENADAGRVAELERDLAKAHAALEEWQRTWAAEHALIQDGAYVVREVPWTDVAAGMMTIARDGTPWMVESCDYTEPGREAFVLRNGEQTFTKKPEPGDTVRVLVPYVTGEQAESLVKGELGGTEVGS